MTLQLRHKGSGSCCSFEVTGKSVMSQATGRVSSAESRVLPVFAGKDEMNIAEFPISLLCDRSPKGQNSVEFSDHIFDSQAGREISRTLTITAPEKYGLPTST